MSGYNNSVMETRLRAAAITDEFSQDLEAVAQAMAGLGMAGAELRVVFGKNILDLSDAEVDRVRQVANSQGLEIVALSSPLLKCTLPGAPPIDSRFQQDVFGAQYAYEDQPRLAARAFEIAHRTGARILRVFSYWRVVEPEAVFDRVAEALGALAQQAAREDLIIGIENEHACNIATGAEVGRLLAAVDQANLQVVWDPANAYVAGEMAFPEGYRAMPPERIAHVHAKDCTLEGHRPIWCPLGEGALDWRGQIAALVADGYRGWVSLETHWPGPQGDKFQGSLICGRNLMALLAE